MRALLPVLALLAAADPAPRLQPGDAAKPFSLPASTGKKVALADYLGQKTVVLAFFPKAFTGG